MGHQGRPTGNQVRDALLESAFDRFAVCDRCRKQAIEEADWAGVERPTYHRLDQAERYAEEWANQLGIRMSDHVEVVDLGLLGRVVEVPMQEVSHRGGKKAAKKARRELDANRRQEIGY